MNAAIAILLSSLLLWAQAVAAYSPPVSSQGARCCRACDCPTSCCAQKTSPGLPPAPLAAQRAAAPTEAFALLALAVFTLPLPPAFADSASVPPAPVSGATPPLYTRLCVLLI